MFPGNDDNQLDLQGPVGDVFDFLYPSSGDESYNDDIFALNDLELTELENGAKKLRADSASPPIDIPKENNRSLTNNNPRTQNEVHLTSFEGKVSSPCTGNREIWGSIEARNGFLSPKSDDSSLALTALWNQFARLELDCASLSKSAESGALPAKTNSGNMPTKPCTRRYFPKC